MSNILPLNLVPIDTECRVKKINSTGLIRRRLLDLGLIENTIVKPLHTSPSGDPIAYLIRGTVIALRSELASTILVEKI